MKTQTNKRRNYKKLPKETKAEVLACVDATGNVAQVADATGIPRQSIQNWLKGIGVDDETQKIRQMKKGEIKDLLQTVVVKCLGLASTKLDNVTADELKGYKISELMTGVGIGIEKMQLLGDEPTQIVESRATDKKAVYEAYIERKLLEAKEQGETVTREQIIESLKQIRPEIIEVLPDGSA